MHRTTAAVAFCLVLFPLAATAQNLDFEDGLTGWIASGSAFARQPVQAADLDAAPFMRMRLGGDYWRGIPFPLGHNGTALIATSVPDGDSATGTLVSHPFRLTPDMRYFSVRVGGTQDLQHERVELQVRIDDSERERAIARWAGAVATRDGNHLTIAAFTGHGYEAVEQVSIEFPALIHHLEARLRIVDASATGHINVDAIQFTSEPLPSRSPSVWGYADYHTHPTDYLAFGGLKNVHTLWGSPGYAASDYESNPQLICADYPKCSRGHGGGSAANPFLNATQRYQFHSTPDVLLFAHGKFGAPDFRNFPAFLAGTHQQMHITQIRRNYDGGLRLMVSLATENLGAEYFVSAPEKNHITLVPERRSMEAQIAQMKEVARSNADWMEIAQSAADARRIILANKLAIVIGVEVDQLGTYVPDSAPAEIEYLWNLGVRAVTPVHAADNRIGGAAVFIGPYNWLNDLFHRPQMDMTLNQVKAEKPHFFEVENDTCREPDHDKGECVQLRMQLKQSRLYLGRCLITLFRYGPCLYEKPFDFYSTGDGGHKNKNGLTAFGRTYLNAIMDRGIILDTAHMSDYSVRDTFDSIGERLERVHPECPGFRFSSDVSDRCNAFAYPAIVSHAHFRAQAYYRDGKPETFAPSEYDIGNRHVELIRRTGGVLGPFVAEERVSDSSTLPFKNDCAMSSKSFGYSFHFALDRMRGTAIGMATDFTFIPGTAPRFGTNACWAFNMAENPKAEKALHKEAYVDQTGTPPVEYNDNAPLKEMPAVLRPYKMNGRAFDFNQEGLAHFGMVPDLLQDLKNLGMPVTDRGALFTSAEAYLQMWERAESLSGKKQQ